VELLGSIVSEPAPMRSGRPTPPEKSVSRSRRTRAPALESCRVTRIETLSGVCPGVWSDRE